MKSFVSLCLALMLAVTFASPPSASAAPKPPQGEMAMHCAEMGMAAMDMAATPAKHPSSPTPSRDGHCQVMCAVGCAMPAPMVTPLIGEPIGRKRAFGRPAAALEPTSAAPEAEDPPPRTILV